MGFPWTGFVLEPMVDVECLVRLAAKGMGAMIAVKLWAQCVRGKVVQVTLERALVCAGLSTHLGIPVWSAASALGCAVGLQIAPFCGWPP